jgi:hypothetical protein
VATIRITANGPYDQAVHLDGCDISHTVHEANVSFAAGTIPTVNLDLAVMGGTTIEAKAEVYMSQRTQNLLIAAGWIPPEGKAFGELELPTAPVEPTTGGQR